MTELALIVARARNGVIGRHGSLPWRLSDDLRHFRRTTLGKTVIVGRTTYESLPNTLMGRRVIVLSRDLPISYYTDRTYDHVRIARSLDDALALPNLSGEVVVIGGAQVYRQAVARASKVYLTSVDVRVDGDAYFKHWFSPLFWRVSERSRLEKNPRNEHSATLTTLVRRWRTGELR